MPILLTLLLACSSSVQTAPETTVDRLTTECTKESKAACLELGQHYAIGGEAPDAEKSKQYLSRACILREATGCAQVAALLDSSDPERTTLLKRACDLDHAPACSGAGVALLQQKPPNQEEALRTFERGCAADDPASCFNLGRALAYGTDVEAMEAAYSKACDADYALACANLATHFSTGARKDLERAASLNRKACSLHHRKSCSEQ